MIRNKFTFIGIGIGLFFLFQTKICATTYPDLTNISFQIKKDTQYVLPENEKIIKKNLIDDIRLFNAFGTAALACIPGSIITFGLSLIAGFVFSIIAIVLFIKIRLIITEYPGFEDDPLIAKKIFRSNLKVIFLVALYGLFVLLFALLIASLLFIDIFLGSAILFSTLFLILFLLFDKLIFNSKPK